MELRTLTSSDRRTVIPLRVETDDLQVAFDLLSADSALRPGVELDAPGGAKVIFRNRTRKRPGMSTGRMDFELVNASAGSVGPLASWLQRCLEGRLSNVRIGGRTVPVELKALHQALEVAIGSS